MKETYFNIVVKRLLKSKGKIVEITEIKKIVQNILDENFTENKAYKIIYHLKNKWYLLSLKKDIYFVKTPEEKIDENIIIETNYWSLLKSHCKTYLNDDWYIWWVKALELNVSNFDIPQEIEIVNPNKQSKEVISTWKYLNFKKYSAKEKQIFKKIKKFTKKIKIWKNAITIAWLELSILESLYNPDMITSGYSQELIKKILRKNFKQINLENIWEIIESWKHHSSINRLYKIAKSIDNTIAEKIWAIIKRYSFFLEVK